MWVFYPLYDCLWVPVALLCLGVLLWPLASRCWRWRLSWLSPGRAVTVLGYAAAGVLAAGLGWLLQARRILLGDADVFLHWYETAEGWMPHPHAPLDGFIRQRVLSGFHDWLGIPFLDLYRLTSCFTLGLLVVGSLLLTRWCAASRRVWILGLLWTGGIVQLGFGYLEIYPLATVFGVFSLLAALRALSRKQGIGLLFFWALLACLAGTWQVMLLPGWLYAVWAVKRKSALIQRIGWMVFLVGILVAGIVSIALLLGQPIDRQTLLAKFLVWECIPLCIGATFSGEPGILSKTHISDFIGTLFLLIPALPLVVWLFLAQGFRRWRRIWNHRFLTLAGARIFPVLFLLFRNPLAGMPRDWDLFAFVGPPLLLIEAEVFLSVPLRRKRGQWLLCALLSQLCLTGTWIAFNHAPENFPKAASRIDAWSTPPSRQDTSGLNLVSGWLEDGLWTLADADGNLYRQPGFGSRPRLTVVPEPSLRIVAAVADGQGYCGLTPDGGLVRVEAEGSVQVFLPPEGFSKGFPGILRAEPRSLAFLPRRNAIVQIDSWNRLWLLDIGNSAASWVFVKQLPFEGATHLQVQPDGNLLVFDRLGRIQTLTVTDTGSESPEDWKWEWQYDSRRLPDAVVADIACTLFTPKGEAVWVHDWGRVEVEGDAFVLDTHTIESKNVEILTGVWGPGPILTLIDRKGGWHEIQPAKTDIVYRNRVAMDIKHNRPWAAMRVIDTALRTLPQLAPKLLPLADESLIHQLAQTRVFTRVQVVPFASRLTMDGDGVAYLCDRWGRIFVHREGVWRMDVNPSPVRLHDLSSDGRIVYGIDMVGMILQLDSISGPPRRPVFNWKPLLETLPPIASNGEEKELKSDRRLTVYDSGQVAVLDLQSGAVFEWQDSEWHCLLTSSEWATDIEYVQRGDERLLLLLDGWGGVKALRGADRAESIAAYNFGHNGARALVSSRQRCYVLDLHGGLHDLEGTGEVIPHSPYVAFDLYADAVWDSERDEIALLTRNGAIQTVSGIGTNP